MPERTAPTKTKEDRLRSQIALILDIATTTLNELEEGRPYPYWTARTALEAIRASAK